MGFRNGAYGKVWQVKAGTGNFTDVRISISKKNRTTNEYEQDFSGFVRFIGDAHKAAGSLKEGDRIKIRECEVTNSYNKEKNTTYTNFAVFSFEMADGSGQNNQAASKAAPKDNFMDVSDAINEELPFN